MTNRKYSPLRSLRLQINLIVKILTSLACLAALAVPCFGQMLSLVDVNTGLSTETLAPGTSLTLAIELTGPSTDSINAFGIQLSSSSSMATGTLTSGTLTSFTTTLSYPNLTINSLPSSLEYAVTDGTTNFLQLSSTPATLVDANITLSNSLAANTTYTIDFAPGSAFQGLTTYSGGQSSLGYTETNFSFTTSPEPSVTALLAVGGLAALAWRLLPRVRSATSA